GDERRLDRQLHAARARQPVGDARDDPAGSRGAAAADPDDGAARVDRPSAGGAVAQHRVGHPAAVRDRDRRGALARDAADHVLAADDLSARRALVRPLAGPASGGGGRTMKMAAKLLVGLGVLGAARSARAAELTSEQAVAVALQNNRDAIAAR